MTPFAKKLLLVLGMVLTLAMVGRCTGGPDDVRSGLDPYPVSAPCLSGLAERRCLSLKALATKVAGPVEKLDADAIVLAGISKPEMVMTDPDNGDVILVGIYQPDAPVLHLDDLVVMLRNAMERQPYIHCSLDPMPKSINRLQEHLAKPAPLSNAVAMEEYRRDLVEAVGPQRTRIGGVNEQSRVAHTMIDADYYMKKVSQGHILVEGVTSGVARSGGAKSMSMARHWFHVADGSPSFVRDEGIIELASCRVVVLTEGQMAAADGSLHDAGPADASSQRFSDEFSEQMTAIAEEEASVARLLSMYKLLALTQAMVHHGFVAKAGLDLTPLVKCPLLAPTPMPNALPGLANIRVTTTETSRHIRYQARIVAGGVSMDVPVTQASFAPASTPVLRETQSKVVAARPTRQALWWPM